MFNNSTFKLAVGEALPPKNDFPLTYVNLKYFVVIITKLSSSLTLYSGVFKLRYKTSSVGSSIKMPLSLYSNLINLSVKTVKR